MGVGTRLDYDDAPPQKRMQRAATGCVSHHGGFEPTAHAARTLHAAPHLAEAHSKPLAALRPKGWGPLVARGHGKGEAEIQRLETRQGIAKSSHAGGHVRWFPTPNHSLDSPPPRHPAQSGTMHRALLSTVPNRAVRAAATAARRSASTTTPSSTDGGKPPVHLRQYLDAWMGSSGTLNKSMAATTPMPASSSSTTAAARPRAASGTANALTVAGKSYLVPTLRLPRGASPEDLGAGLRATTSLSAGYFRSAPIVVDLAEWMVSQPLPRGGVKTDAAGVGGEVLDGDLLQAFVAALKEAGLHPVGISNATATDVQAAALELGLPCFMGRHTSAPTTVVAAAAPAPSASSSPPPKQAVVGPARIADLREEAAIKRGQAAASAAPKKTHTVTMVEEDEDKDVQAHKKRTAAAAAATDDAAAASSSFSPLPTKVVQGSVRTGQQVVAEGASLVILGHVNSGAEVSADGDIHVYGKLTGRALAGLSVRRPNPIHPPMQYSLLTYPPTRPPIHPGGHQGADFCLPVQCGAGGDC